MIFTALQDDCKSPHVDLKEESKKHKKDKQYLYTASCPPPTLYHIPSTHLPHHSPDGLSKLQSGETLRPQSISPRDSAFPAELLTQGTTAHIHCMRCYVSETEMARENNKMKERRGDNRHRSTAPHSGALLYHPLYATQNNEEM